MDEFTRAKHDGDEPATASEAANPAGAPLVDWTIDSYRVLSRLGEGGFGDVFLAEQTAPVRRRVALKIIKPGMDSRSVMRRFQAEQQALAMMEHPNVAKVFDAGMTSNGRSFFAMELVRGVPVTEHCDRHKLTIRQRVELFLDICAAIQHAHQKGVIHRDIKPSNILVGYEGSRAVTKVIDFGVAKALNARLTEQTIQTELGQLIGTPEYMSPEQAEMTSQDVDTRSDVYSLGVLLYELLTGALPFEGKTLRGAGLSEIQRIIREVEPPRPSTRLHRLESEEQKRIQNIVSSRRADLPSLVREIKGDLDWIVVKCLEKDRSRRYETADALAMDLRRYLAHEPVLASPPDSIYRLRKFARRNRGPLIAASIVLVAILGGFATSVWQAVRATRAERRAELNLVEAVQAREAEAEQRAEAEAARRVAEERTEEAERQAAIATSINQFLTDDLLGAVDMNVAQGRDITVREVFDRATETLDHAFPAQPLVEASIRDTFGRVYSSLGYFDEARTEFEKGLALLEANAQTDTLAIADLFEQFAWTYRAEGAEAAQRGLEMMRRVVDIRSRVLGDQDPRTQRARGDVAMFAAMTRGEIASGLDPLTMAAIATARGMGESPDELKRHFESVMALLIRTWASGEKDRAFAIIDAEIAPIRANRFSRERVPSALAGFARRLLSEDRVALAEPIALYARDAAHEIHGRLHEYTMFTEAVVGELYIESNRIEDSIPYFERALAIAVEADGTKHPFVGLIRYQLARGYAHIERFADAERLLLEALDQLPADYSAQADIRLSATVLLGATLLRAGTPEEGERLLRIALRDAEYGEYRESKIRFDASLALARHCVETERRSEAEQWLTTAQHALENDPDTAKTDRVRRFEEISLMLAPARND